jgi:hypothetical protein
MGNMRVRSDIELIVKINYVDADVGSLR